VNSSAPEGYAVPAPLVAPVVFIYALIMILSHTHNSLYVRNENIESRSVCLLVLVLLTVKHVELWLTLSCYNEVRPVVGFTTNYAKGLSPLML
jgi:hypothetical protein